MEDTELVTVKELVECIGRRMQETGMAAGIRGIAADELAGTDEGGGASAATGMQEAGAEDIWAYGLRRKWLEAQDAAHQGDLIERRQAARILHEFLRKELQEPDLPDHESAKCLLDLYDCRVCVNHVAQVYGKGIMSGITQNVFGMKEGILQEELTPMVERLFARGKRLAM